MASSEVRRVPRPVLRPAHTGDAALLKRWRAEPTVRRHQPLREATLAQLRAELSQQRPDDLYHGQGEKFQWIISCEDQPAGWITLVIINWDHGLAEIGYATATRYQRRGLMPAALEQLLYDLFLHSELRRIEARCSIENFASQKVLEKTNFRREGVLRGYFLLEDLPVDNYLYAILRDEFVPLTLEP